MPLFWRACREKPGCFLPTQLVGELGNDRSINRSTDAHTLTHTHTHRVCVWLDRSNVPSLSWEVKEKRKMKWGHCACSFVQRKRNGRRFNMKNQWKILIFWFFFAFFLLKQKKKIKIKLRILLSGFFIFLPFPTGKLESFWKRERMTPLASGGNFGKGFLQVSVS